MGPGRATGRRGATDHRRSAVHIIRVTIFRPGQLSAAEGASGGAIDCVNPGRNAELPVRAEPAGGTGPTPPRARVKSARNRPAAAGNFAGLVSNLRSTKARRGRITNRSGIVRQLRRRPHPEPAAGPVPSAGKPVGNRALTRPEPGRGPAGPWSRTGRTLVADRPGPAATPAGTRPRTRAERAGNAGPKPH